MGFVHGMLFMGVFFVCVIAAFIAGQRTRPAQKPAEVDEEAQRQAVKMHKQFQQLMNYDVKTALKRKEVT